MPRRWVCAGILLLLCAAGCGAARGAPPAASPEAMRFVATAPPAGETPGRGPVNLVFVTLRRGFVATTGGGRDVARLGWVLPSAPGEIERTRDGGATWQTLWRGRLSFDALVVRRRLIVAAGMRMAETGRRDPRFTPFRRHVLLVSRDGGRTWGRQSLPVRGPVALQVLAPRLWLAFRAGDFDLSPRRGLLRSDDAGRHWRTVPLPRGAQAVRFATPLVGVTSAHAQSCRGGRSDEDGRRMQLWRTMDGGRTWRPLAGTCAPSYSVADFDFVTPHLAFAVQGHPDSLHRSGVLRRSSDGGATWTTIVRDRERAPIRVQFSDRRHGTLAEEVDLPTHSLMLLASTTDGGHTWARHGLPAQPLPVQPIGLDISRTPLPAIVGRDVWVGHTRAGVVWHTDDGGRRWALTTAPRFLDPGSDTPSQAMLAGSGVLMVSSGAGPVQSHDGGRTWTPARWPSDRDATLMEGRGAYVVRGDKQDQARLVTPTGSERLNLPKGVRHLSQVAFTNARDGVLAAWDSHDDDETLYATHDGGRSWASVVPSRRRPAPSFALAPGIIVDAGDTGVSVTTDEGASWQTLERRLPDGYCEASRPSALDIWITCAVDSRTILFRSGDGGRTWTRRVSDRDLRLSGTGGAEAWATPRDLNPAGDSTTFLWHSTDGGATWTQAWVSLPPRARARQIDCAIIPSGVLHDPLDRCR